MDMPTLPFDSLHKFFLIGGLVAIISSLYFFQNAVTKYNNKIKRIDSLEIYQNYDKTVIMMNERNIKQLPKSKEKIEIINAKVDSLTLINIKLKNALILNRKSIDDMKDNNTWRLIVLTILTGGLGIVTIAIAVWGFSNWQSTQKFVDEIQKMQVINLDLQNLKLERELNVFQDSRSDYDKGLTSVNESKSDV